MDKEDINSRILKVYESSGLNKGSFANKLEISQAVLTHISTGRNKAGLEIINSILINYPEINPDWLITGKGKMFRENEKNKDLIKEKLALLQLKIETLKIEIKSIESLLNELNNLS